MKTRGFRFLNVGSCNLRNMREREPENGETPGTGWEWVQKIFWAQGATSLLHWCKWGCTGSNRVRMVQRPLGDLCSLSHFRVVETEGSYRLRKKKSFT